MDKRYHIVTYGCQMNVHDSEKIAGMLTELGYSPCDSMDEADIVVFNTCCIRENAENHAYGNIGMLKKLKAKKRDMIIAVGGCMPQQIGKADILHKKFPYVDIIFGTHNLNRLKAYVEEKLGGKKSVIEIYGSEGEVVEGEKPLRTSYPNAWINIMYGCNNFCSYCIVPYVRGRERSRRSENVIAEARSLIADGYKELTLLGQNVNSYANGTDDIRFPTLLERIAEIDGKFRLRFMTSHPKDFSEELARAMASDKKICRSLHLPVQSGSDRILSAMNRKYTAADYLRKIDILKKYIPDCAVTTDLIVGFPGETDEDFRATLNLVREVGFSSAFTFVYSRREGTVAAKMPGQIPEEVSKERIMELVALVNSLTREQSAKYVGRTCEILCEGYDEKRGLFLGRDEYGRMGYFACDKNVIGEFVTLAVKEANGVSLMGELV
ncbi:MAG TPA: tRNA (N6-isopentenyl adenosine(37)-C2)-methylthiotransferase MiaB [Candidatus Coproplasma stercoripullorum]|uniref:tRNA-2-methylthio-N(6)-dimethylallyladenosine synthase n=1 Tax=Candidatus Coproplasma stercoripullorum TaxID=2840751 RepID=A0A9D1AH31_9FIRM|nr:tRNA (N6-isopentenyl adenosine(37)-C2)-methylthiotransferase MiaB [Candidatus Coproplasma stercoripullorum]